MQTSYKLLKTYEFLHKADLDLINLKNAGLNVYLTDSNTVNLAPFYANAVGGIKMYVAEQEFDRAKEILANGVTYDEELKNVFQNEDFHPAMRCPNCNSPDIFQERSVLSGIFFLIAFFLPVSITKNKYHCVKCDYQWKIQ